MALSVKSKYLDDYEWDIIESLDRKDYSNGMTVYYHENYGQRSIYAFHKTDGDVLLRGNKSSPFAVDGMQAWFSYDYFTHMVNQEIKKQGQQFFERNLNLSPSKYTSESSFWNAALRFAGRKVPRMTCYLGDIPHVIPEEGIMYSDNGVDKDHCCFLDLVSGNLSMRNCVGKYPIDMSVFEYYYSDGRQYVMLAEYQYEHGISLPPAYLEIRRINGFMDGKKSAHLHAMGNNKFTASVGQAQTFEPAAAGFFQCKDGKLITNGAHFPIIPVSKVEALSYKKEHFKINTHLLGKLHYSEQDLAAYHNELNEWILVDPKDILHVQFLHDDLYTCIGIAEHKGAFIVALTTINIEKFVYPYADKYARSMGYPTYDAMKDAYPAEYPRLFAGGIFRNLLPECDKTLGSFADRRDAVNRIEQYINESNNTGGSI